MTGQSIKIILKQYIKHLVPSRSIGFQTILIKSVISILNITVWYNWSDSNLKCPPTYLIKATINHLRICKARDILIVPEWPSSLASFTPERNSCKFYHGR